MSGVDKVKANEWKDKGNALLSAKDYDGAIAAYTEVCDSMHVCPFVLFL